MLEQQLPKVAERESEGSVTLARLAPAAHIPSGEAVLRFRRFTVLPNARQLLADGVPIDVGSRAFDLLVVLLQSRGTIVSKAEIFRHVWPSTTVEESNLRFQMASLRTALGEDRDVIKTIPGRGYLLVAEAFIDATLTRPVMTGPDDVPTDMADDTMIAADASAHPTVAIIDDDRGVREALEGLLMSAGLATESFGSAQEFRDRQWAAPPACLILDVWLPGINGIDFHHELGREGRQPPVIFISGHADVHTSVRAMKAGAVEFLTKPVRHQELLDAVQAAITR
ncbi:response regulator [Sphingomonas sp. AR_OL41]|uniref:response regulator n=1 Tax=Sphingomonas sp. AR_OL41 TaxID=3042729 RepID=UPI002480A373|nr:response regulator [Sphingomonas sp. AR_OL41]MDH7972859.1 response regulator [Sphingomonas sp. AR_OL41]